MKFKLMTLILAFGFITMSCNNDSIKVGKKVSLNTMMDSVAYAIGVNFGRQLKQDSVKIDYNIFVAGINDAYEGDTVYLSDQDIKNVMLAFQQDVQARAQARMVKEIEKNKAEGEKFLAENKNKKGVKVTASGLQYEVIKEGAGKKPTDTSTVKVHYKGTLLNGKVFDSSYERNEPVEFQLNRVIKGWQEGLKLMPVGSKYRFYIPYNLAYGEQGAPPQVPPASTLIFDVELLDIVK